MDNFIVKLRSYKEGECIRYGTGIVISSERIVTATHVVCGDQHTVVANEEEIPLSIVQKNDAVAILFSEQTLAFAAADIFSVDEIHNRQTLWAVNGYITEGQNEHHMTGSGIIYSETDDTRWDHYLSSIESGWSGSYDGLSGAPVQSRGRIVGILQIQSSNVSGVLGIQMASVEMFHELLYEGNLQSNEYEMLIRDESQSFSRNQVEVNKRSRKYIPDIFVEEGQYKEQLRYFADPHLFVKKAILDSKCLDFSAINRYLTEMAIPEIDFSSLSTDFSHDELETVTNTLSNLLSCATETLNTCRERGEIKDLGIERYFHFQSTINYSMRYYLENQRELVDFARQRYVLLTKRAGQGKTNFLCDFTENFLLKKGYIVLYLNANEIREDPLRLIKHTLSVRGQYDDAYVSQVLDHTWKKTGRPLVIVIDGLNENTIVPAFGDCMRNFLDECNNLPYLKVIMSTRKELLEERFGGLLRAGEQIPFQHLDMERTDDGFKERIFHGYLNFFNIGIRWNTLTQRVYEMLTNDVLLLRFFSEVNENKQQVYMYDVYKYDVFSQYLSIKAQEYQQYDELVDATELLDSLLEHICKHMIECKTYSHVPLTAFNREQQQLLNRMLQNEVIFKDEAIVEKGIVQRNSAVISFTFDEFRDFCLTNYLLSNYHRREDFLGFWKEMQQENLTICEGVQKYIFYLSKTKYRDKLLPIVKELDEYNELYWEYIWDIEDQYISEADAALWKAQMLENREHMYTVVRHILFKYDCECFTGVNIKLLFEVLDGLTGELDRYSRFINTLFSPTKKDKYGREQLGQKTAFPFNHLLKGLHEHIEDYDRVSTRLELFRMVVYLYELASKHAQALWDKLYQLFPSGAIMLLQEMNCHESSLIKGNVKDVLQGLLKVERGDEYDDEIKRLNAENGFGQDISGFAQMVADIIAGGQWHEYV